MSGGYGNPPKTTRFQKGQAGTQKGKSRQADRPMSSCQLFRKVANEQVLVKIDQVPKRVTRLEAVMRQIGVLALHDPNAARLLLRLRDKFPQRLPNQKFITVFSDNEMKY